MLQQKNLWCFMVRVKPEKMHQTGILSRLIGKQTEIDVNLKWDFHLNVLNAPCLQWINLQRTFNPELFRLAVQNIAACPFKLKKKWSWKVKYVIKISRNKSISLIPSLFSLSLSPVVRWGNYLPIDVFASKMIIYMRCFLAFGVDLLYCYSGIFWCTPAVFAS